MSDSNWKEVPLADLVDLNPEALSNSTPSATRFQYIDISSVHPGVIDWQTVPECSFATAPSRARRIVRPKDSLFCTVRPSLQAHAYADWNAPDGYVCSTGFAVLRPSRSDSRFIFHKLFCDELASQVRQREVGSSYPAVNESELRQMLIAVPPTTEEQTRIAEILDKLDEAIREAEAVIAKLRQVKAGLLHDLLTRGLDEHGHLREPIRHPDQFQDSPLGLIPKAWTDTTLGHVLRERGGTMQTGPFGSQLHSSDYATEGIPVIMPQDIGDDGEMDTVAAAKITPERAQLLSRHRIRQGDIIFARRGDLSRCGVARSTAVGLCGTGCLLYRPAPKSLHPEWFATVYRHDFVQKQIAAKAVGTTMVNLNTGLLTSLELAVPDWNEQVEIVDRIISFGAKIRAEETILDKLQSLKRGLSHDLLTGRKRVKV